jgi:hypothetical protein
MSSAGGEQVADDELEPAEIHDVLRNERRRLVIERLRNERDTETVRDLSEYIASVESGEDPPPRNVRQSVYVSLHQTHLPKLDELGIVFYDSDAKEVSLAGRADEVAVYMEVVPKYGLSWGEYYLGLGLIGVLLVVGSSVGAPGLGSVTPGVLALADFVVIICSAVYHIYTQQSSLFHRVRD